MIHCYRRVSTEDQVNGPLAQDDAINRWLRAHNYIEPSFFDDYFDKGVSGSIRLQHRPEGSRMLYNLKPGDTIIVAKLDRLFRSVADAAITLDAWNKQSVTLVSLAENFDMTTPYGKAMAHIMSALAELERGLIRQRTIDSVEAKKARGEPVGPPPYGWMVIDGKLAKASHEQTILDIMLHYHHTGLKPGKIAKKLNERGMLARCGRPWNKEVIRGILKRELDKPADQG